MSDKAAEILVKAGYADSHIGHTLTLRVNYPNGVMYHPQEKVDYTVDDLEGRRQADALEDWLRITDEHLWRRSFLMGNLRFGENHQWRLDRIKWCLEQLEPPTA